MFDRTCTLSHQDWSLHRKADQSANRHREKLKEAIQDRLTDIISDGSIITDDGKKTVRVPLKGLSLPRFVHKRGKGGPSGTAGGDGDSKVGDVIGYLPDDTGKGPGAGQGDGEDVYEVEISVDELAELLFERMQLPRLQPKNQAQDMTEAVSWTDRRKIGPMANLDKKRMLLENIKRNALAGAARFGDIQREDLRFRTYREKPKPKTRAVLIGMRDVSGSMGEFEQWVSRCCYFWIVRFLRTCYLDVEFVFITHQDSAKEVDEHQFFYSGEDGGTRVAPAYTLAQKIMQERYPDNDWNIYVMHFTDGDTYGDTDMKQCLQLVQDMLPHVNLFGYAEIRRHDYGNVLSKTLSVINDPRFVHSDIRSKDDVGTTLQRFFGEQQERKTA